MQWYEMLNFLDVYGIEAYVVGGFVRDSYLGLKSKDIDIEVYGTEYEELVHVMSQLGDCNIVGKKFGVVKITVNKTEFELALARTETANTRNDTTVNLSTEIRPPEAILRRDFTINTLLLDKNGKILDYCGAINDLKNKILRPTSEKFKDDATRVLRAMRFISKYGMEPAPILYKYAREIKHKFHEIESDSQRSEWLKWAETAYPHYGYEFLRKSGWTELYPDLFGIEGIQQNPKYHPEGTVDIHTYLSLKNAGEFKIPEVTFATLLHDLGKQDYTQTTDGVIKSHGHNDPSRAISFMEQISLPHKFIETVARLVDEHMFDYENATQRSIRRLKTRLNGPDELVYLLTLMQCDKNGRGKLINTIPDGLLEFIRIYNSLNETVSIERKITGKDLFKNGIPRPTGENGPRFGKALDAAYQRQIDDDLPYDELLEIAITTYNNS